LELHHVKMAMDTCRRHLRDLADESSASVAARINSIVSQMDLDTSAKLANADAMAVSSGRAIEVLRQSLDQTEHRCRNLNAEMLRQAEAHEELVSNLNTTKDANKRLLEQMRHHTDEIADLTQQRVEDEQRMEHMTRTHRFMEEEWRQEMNKRVSQAQKAADEKYNSMYRLMSDKLRQASSMLTMLRQELGYLRVQVTELKGCTATFGSTVEDTTRSVERRVIAQLESRRRDTITDLQDMEDRVHDLQVKLAGEKDIRQNEVSQWSQRFTSLQTEKEALERQLAQQTTSLSSQVESLQQSLTGDRDSFHEERRRLDEQLQEMARQRSGLEAGLDKAKREATRLDAQVLAMDAELGQKDAQLVELRKQIRESDDALASAIDGHDHLRDQLEEQRRRYQDMNDRDLADTRMHYEEKMAQLKDQWSGDLGMHNRQIQELEEELTEKVTALERLRQAHDVLDSETTNLTRDVNVWKTQHENVAKARSEADQQLAQARQAWAGDKQRLQAEVEEMQQSKSQLGAEFEELQVHFAEFKKSSSTRDAESRTHIAALEDELSSLAAELAELKGKHQDVSEQLAKRQEEVSTTSNKLVETESSLRRGLEQAQRQHGDEVGRLQDQIEAERRDADEMKAQYERYISAHLETLRQAKEDQDAALDNLEQDHAKKVDKLRAETADAGRQLTAAHTTIDELENELRKHRQLVSETQSELHHLQAAQEERDRSFALAQSNLEDDCRHLSQDLDHTKRHEAAVAAELESSRSKWEAEKLQLKRELETAKAKVSSESIHSKQAVDRMKNECDVKLGVLESRHRDEVERVKDKYDALHREHQRLQRFVAENRQATATVAALPAGWDSALNRMQSHVSELRGDLMKASPSRQLASPQTNRSSANSLHRGYQTAR